MVGLRYTRARRRNRFIGVNSAVSMIGIALGVWALIVVLSVMNGFQKEVRTRILGVASHLQILAGDNRLADWQRRREGRGAAPARGRRGAVRAGAGDALRRPGGARRRGARHPAGRGGEGRRFRAPHARRLARRAAAGEFGMVLGADLARALGVLRGDKVALIAPQGIVTPGGRDSAPQAVHRGRHLRGRHRRGRRRARAGPPARTRRGSTRWATRCGVRLKLDDLFAARAVARDCS